jgi:predicted nucleotidyltransferase/DNA-binding HxlR family transcriptional regulator
LVVGVGKILGSDAKVQILRTLSHIPQALSAEEIEQEITKGISMVYTALRELEEEGVLEAVKPEGKKTYYRLDADTVLGKAVQELFAAEDACYGVDKVPAKPLNIAFAFLQALQRNVDVELVKVMLFGSTVRGAYTPQSDIDLYIVTENRDVVEAALPGLKEKFDASFSFIVRTSEEYQKDFTKPLASLAKSLLVDGYALLHGDREEDQRLQEKFTKHTPRSETVSMTDEVTATEV